MENRQKLPNAVAVLVLGICSIIFGCFIIGMVLGIIGLSMSKKGRRLNKANPGQYEGAGMLTAGYILSLIGTILGAIYTLYLLIAVMILGGTALSFSDMF